jgi:hypothetical protein
MDARAVAGAFGDEGTEAGGQAGHERSSVDYLDAVILTLIAATGIVATKEGLRPT